MQRIAHAVFDIALVLGAFHVDKVDDDQTADVAQTQLAGDFISGFQVGAQRGFFDVAALGGARRVHVNRPQRFGAVDHNRAARRQSHFTGVSGFDLMFDLEPREQRHVIFVELDAVGVARHDMAHELASLLENGVGIDQDFADVRLEIITDRADHQARFLINQESAALRAGCAFDGIPQLQQVVHIPLQFFQIAANGGGASDQAHAGRGFQLIHHGAQLVALFAFDAARNAAATRIVWHQHDITAGQTDIGGQCSALVAALVFFNLDDEFLAFTQSLNHAAAAGAFAIVQIGAGNFLEGKEAMTITAVIDKAGFEGGFDTGDDTLVDIGLALFLANRFDVQIDQLLSIDDGNAQLFSLRCIKQHAFHKKSPARSRQDRQTRCRRNPIRRGGEAAVSQGNCGAGPKV